MHTPENTPGSHRVPVWRQTRGEGKPVRSRLRAAAWAVTSPPGSHEAVSPVSTARKSPILSRGQL